MHVAITVVNTRVVPKLMSNNFFCQEIVYFWKNKIHHLILQMFLISPHNSHLVGCIFPTVVEVWKSLCDRTSFQHLSSSDELLSSCPPMFRNAGLTFSPSEDQTDGNWRELSRDCRRDVEELSTPFSRFLSWCHEECGASHCHAGRWFFTWMFITFHHLLDCTVPYTKSGCNVITYVCFP